MSGIKALPDNLKELEESTEFKKVYKQFTTAQFEDKLTEAGVARSSDDDKGDLTWRWLDHQGYDFELESYATDKATINPTDNTTDTTINQDNTNQADSDNDDTADPDGGNTNDGSSSDRASDPSESTQPVTSIDKGDSNETMEKQSANSDDTPAQDEDAIDTDNASGQGSGSSDAAADSASESSHQGSQKGADKAAVKEREYVEVKSSGAFDMLEPATGTLVKAGETTKVYIKGHATKERVLRNIAQYNHTRGNKLTIIN